MSSSNSVIPGSVPPAFLPSEAEDSSSAGSSGLGSGPVRAQNEEKSKKRRRLEYPPAPEPLPVPVFDNHAHLDFRDGLVEVSVADHLDTAAAVGVVGAICVGYDVSSSVFSVQAAKSDARLKAAVALHPNDAPVLAARGEYSAAFSQIVELADDPQVVAVGETGLDYFRTGEDGRAAQLQSFRDHIELAADKNLAMQIHDRDAHEDVVKALLEAPRLPDSVIFHCFSGDEQLARICNEHGWYMSFSGTVTFKNSDSLRAALSVADRQLVLVETDAPFLTPHPYRGQPNAPYLIPQTMRSMLATLQESGHTLTLDGLCQQVMMNTTQAYGSWT